MAGKKTFVVVTQKGDGSEDDPLEIKGTGAHVKDGRLIIYDGADNPVAEFVRYLRWWIKE